MQQRGIVTEEFFGNDSIRCCCLTLTAASRDYSCDYKTQVQLQEEERRENVVHNLPHDHGCHKISSADMQRAGIVTEEIFGKESTCCCCGTVAAAARDCSCDHECNCRRREDDKRVITIYITSMGATKQAVQICSEWE